MATGRGSTRARHLIAIILVTRSRPGPHLVFHYPPIPQSSCSKNESGTADEVDSDEDLEPDLDPRNGSSASVSNGANGTNTNLNKNADTSADVNKNGQSADTILGFSEETLQRMLSPGCWSDRKKFEICLDRLTFVGHPIYAAQDGSWARKHTHSDEVSKTDRRSSTPTPSRPEEDIGDTQTSIGITITEPRTPARPAQDFTHVPESFDSRAEGPSVATSMNSGSSISAAVVPEQLTMFHVVFVLASSDSANSHQEVSDMYQHVGKKLSKALHYCQNQTQYLGFESKKLLMMKAKARQDGIADPKILCEQMLESSELAWALKEVYEKIAAGEIAGIRLNGMPVSLQIPPSTSLKRTEESELTGHSGLLLLEDKGMLLRELEHPDASPLVYFIREHTPNKSLQKQAVKLGMPFENIIALARHLVKWRKARIIAPLHQRNTYIAGRDAPLDQLESYYIADYGRKFSVLPSLPQVLKALSGKPIKYGMLIPSRDHRDPYMEILAYLIQHRFVEQLKTYGWLQAPTTPVTKVHRVEEEVNQNRRPLSVMSLLSPQMRPVRDDDSVSVSSERTTIPISVVEGNKMQKDVTASPLDGIAKTQDEMDGFKIVTEPHKLSVEDTQRLQHIQDSLSDEELSERLPSLLRHFGGENACEEIAATEGLKRSKVETWLDSLQKEGFLMSFRSL